MLKIQALATHWPAGFAILRHRGSQTSKGGSQYLTETRYGMLPVSSPGSPLLLFVIALQPFGHHSNHFGKVTVGKYLIYSLAVF